MNATGQKETLVNESSVNEHFIFYTLYLQNCTCVHPTNIEYKSSYFRVKL